MTMTTTDGSELLATSGLGASLGQAIAFAMLRMGGLPFPSAQILAGQWDGVSLAGSLAMLDEAVDSGAWGEAELYAFLDTLDLGDLTGGSSAGLAALEDGLVHDPFLAALADAGLTAAFFGPDRVAGSTLTAAAAALTALLNQPENHAPQATGLAPAAVTLAEGTGLTLHLADFFSDGDDDALSFSVTSPLGDVPYHLTETGDLVLAPGFASSGFHGLILAASDGQASAAIALDVNVTEAGAATRLTSMDFSRQFGEAETFADALAATAKSRGIDIIDQTALGDGTHTIAVDNLVLRAGADLHGTFTLAETARVLTLRGFGEFTVTGNAGANVVYGGGGNETMTGGTANDQLHGEAGADLLYGGADADKLWGGAGSDSLYGETGEDQLFGGEGDDYLRGGTGRDQATGGAGADVFDFFKGDGIFTIRDAASGEDIIRLNGFAGVTDAASLLAQATVQEFAEFTRVTLDGDMLNLYGLRAADLTDLLFDFA